MLVTEFQDILKHVNSKFIKRIDILNNYVDLYNDETKKAVKVSICNSTDLFREAIYEAVRQIKDKFIVVKDTKEFLNFISKHWNEKAITFTITRLEADDFIELKDIEQKFLIGKYIIAPSEASKITRYFEGVVNPTLKELLDIIK